MTCGEVLDDSAGEGDIVYAFQSRRKEAFATSVVPVAFIAVKVGDDCVAHGDNGVENVASETTVCVCRLARAVKDEDERSGLGSCRRRPENGESSSVFIYRQCFVGDGDGICGTHECYGNA